MRRDKETAFQVFYVKGFTAPYAPFGQGGVDRRIQRVDVDRFPAVVAVSSERVVRRSDELFFEFSSVVGVVESFAGDDAPFDEAAQDIRVLVFEQVAAVAPVFPIEIGLDAQLVPPPQNVVVVEFEIGVPVALRIQVDADRPAIAGRDDQVYDRRVRRRGDYADVCVGDVAARADQLAVVGDQ